MLLKLFLFTGSFSTDDAIHCCLWETPCPGISKIRWTAVLHLNRPRKK